MVWMSFGLKQVLYLGMQWFSALPTVLATVLQQPPLRAPLAISLGAIAGALSRYYLTLWFTARFGTSFPFGTFFINLSGCLGMGFFTTLALERWTIAPDLRLLVTTGFLGAYTTFSTYGLDTVNLLRIGDYSKASFYWLGSALLGIVAVQLGTILARLGNPH